MGLRTNLRKTFSYPSSDTSSTSDPAELDEEHQEHLITRLAQEDASKSHLYRTLFLTIPSLSALFFLHTLLFTAETARKRGEAILSISSLLCTAYILRFQPLGAPENENGRGKGRGKSRMGYYGQEEEKGPLERLLLPLNLVLMGLMLFTAGMSWSRGAVEEGWREALPAIVLVLCLFVRWQLKPLDLEELKGARYDLKGA